MSETVVSRSSVNCLVALFLGPAIFAGLFATAGIAQPAPRRPAADSIEFRPGSTVRRFTLNVTQSPAVGDSIEVTLPSKSTQLVILTPDGKRITSSNAEASGYRWWAGEKPAPRVPLGGDTTQMVVIWFAKPCPVGAYVLQFTSVPLRRAAHAEIKLVSRLADFQDLLKNTPGAEFRSAPVGPDAVNFTFDSGDIATPAVLDIVLATPDDDVSVTLPDGRVLKPGATEREQYAWESYAQQFDKPSGPIFSVMAMPVDGTHHSIFFTKPAKGRYAVRGKSRSKQGHFLAAWVPVTVSQKQLEPNIWLNAVQAPGKVKIERTKQLPSYCTAGDRLPFAVSFPDGLGQKSPRFETRVQVRNPLHPSDAGEQYAGEPASTRTQPASLTLGSDGAWHGELTLDAPGFTLASLRVSAETQAGQPFVEEVLLNDLGLEVEPIAARLLSLHTKGVDDDGDGRFEHLDVVAELEIFYPGHYDLVFRLADAEGQSLDDPEGPAPHDLQRVSRKLSRGRQTLTRVIAGDAIWKQLGDGPLELKDVSIIAHISVNGTPMEDHPRIEIPKGAELRTEAWRRNKWNPGGVYGEDTVNVQGVRPSTSGRFRFVELKWNVTTPGGLCNWSAAIRSPASTIWNPNYPLGWWTTAEYGGDLPAGQTTLTFDFPGALIAANGDREWIMTRQIGCQQPTHGMTVPNPKQRFKLDHSQYEPAHESFAILATNPIRRVPGKRGFPAYLQILNRTRDQARFQITNSPPELVTSLREDTRGNRAQIDVDIFAPQNTKPGRYVIEVAAQSGDETATTELLVDVSQE